MNTLIVWLVVLTPKQACKDAVNAKRAAAAAQMVEVAKSTSNAAGIESARAALEKLKEDPQPSIIYSLEDPKDAKVDPCFDRYAKPIELSIKK